MADDPHETFRAGVGLVVVDVDGRVLALERSDVPGAWQLPQGGVTAGEDLEATAWRELFEETALGRDDVTLEAVSPVWIGYELPEHMRRPKTGRGQVHRWYLFRMRPGAVVPPAQPQGDDEFRAHEWVHVGELLDRAVSFRRPVYETMSGWFAEFLTS